MPFHIYFPLIRARLLLFLAALLVGGGGLSASYFYWQDRQAAAQLSRNALQQTQVKHQATVVLGETIQSNYPVYQQIQGLGLMGEERRLNWVEAIEQLKLELGLFSMDYTLLPQRRFEPTLHPPLQQLTVLASRMELKFKLLHEAELFNFFERLRARAKGFFVIRHCSIERLTRGSEISATQPNISADCKLDWLTFREGVQQPLEQAQ